MAETKTTFTLIDKKRTPSGYWDNGIFKISNNTVEIPNHILKDAIITTFKDGLKGLNTTVSKIVVGGEKYLVLGKVKN